jgi:hypothetical protein
MMLRLFYSTYDSENYKFYIFAWHFKNKMTDAEIRIYKRMD